MARILSVFERTRFRVTGIELDYVPDIKSDWIPEQGIILTRSKGFPSKNEVPRPSFKIYKAMCAAGIKGMADSILRNYKRSYITPNYVWESVKNFSHPTAQRTKNPAYYKALEKLRMYMQVEKKIDPIDMRTASSQIPQSTSPGLPYIITHPGMKKGDILALDLQKFEDFWDGLYGSRALLPDSAAFARSHISSPDKNKVRPVWAVPLVVICQEARFAIPLTEMLLKQEICTNTAYGCEMMKGGMMWLNSQVSFSNIRYPGTKYFMTDYSSFDAFTPSWVIRDVFNIVMEKFNLTEDDEHKFRRVVNYFINTPIRNSDGRRFKKNHGVPSGSMFTNVIDTLINMVVSWTCCDVTFSAQPLWDIYFGDDGLMALPPETILDIQAYSRAADYIFGMKVNVDKSYWTSNPNNIHFLGYYNYIGTPYKEAETLLAAMLYPQHLKDDWGYCLTRALGCLLASAGACPDVFNVCYRVYMMACNHGTNIEEAIERMYVEPRAFRHLQTMGLANLRLTRDFFLNPNLSIPMPNCTKFQKNVMLVR